jgi:hypothetical protein
MSIDEDLQELGLSKTCGHLVVTQINGQLFKDPCDTPVVEYGGKCTKHGGLELVKQQKALHQKTVLAQRQKLEEEVLPKATQRILDILNNEEAKDADVINIWKTVMDRIGLAAVQGVVVEGNIQIEAPLDILRRMLAGQPEIVDAEIVEEE